uniref:Uncharacterized protein n=1 Tax=Romanomermis culicivorax TaxID=13658 RepID=A0A915JL99_ROMCU
MHHHEFDPCKATSSNLAFPDYDVSWNELVDNRDFKVFEIRPVKCIGKLESIELCKYDPSYNEVKPVKNRKS